MSHANALLTPKGRLRLARCVVEDGWSLHRAAERFQVSVTTAARWAGRYRTQGEDGMEDRSSRPVRSPQRTPARRERRIIAIKVNRRCTGSCPGSGWPGCTGWNQATDSNRDLLRCDSRLLGTHLIEDAAARAFGRASLM
ncbi:transposase-like protein [Arthrobacter sp. W4I7]|nr:transposase-like protein [Arthrobacter sp. W4I7]